MVHAKIGTVKAILKTRVHHHGSRGSSFRFEAKKTINFRIVIFKGRQLSLVKTVHAKLRHSKANVQKNAVTTTDLVGAIFDFKQKKTYQFNDRVLKEGDSKY